MRKCSRLDGDAVRDRHAVTRGKVRDQEARPRDTVIDRAVLTDHRAGCTEARGIEHGVGQFDHVLARRFDRRHGLVLALVQRAEQFGAHGTRVAGHRVEWRAKLVGQIGHGVGNRGGLHLFVRFLRLVGFGCGFARHQGENAVAAANQSERELHPFPPRLIDSERDSRIHPLLAGTNAGECMEENHAIGRAQAVHEVTPRIIRQNGERRLLTGRERTNAAFGIQFHHGLAHHRAPVEGRLGSCHSGPNRLRGRAGAASLDPVQHVGPSRTVERALPHALKIAPAHLKKG